MCFGSISEGTFVTFMGRERDIGASRNRLYDNGDGGLTLFTAVDEPQLLTSEFVPSMPQGSPITAATIIAATVAAATQLEQSG